MISIRRYSTTLEVTTDKNNTDSEILEKSWAGVRKRETRGKKRTDDLELMTRDKMLEMSGEDQSHPVL